MSRVQKETFYTDNFTDDSRPPYGKQHRNARDRPKQLWQAGGGKQRRDRVPKELLLSCCCRAVIIGLWSLQRTKIKQRRTNINATSRPQELRWRWILSRWYQKVVMYCRQNPSSTIRKTNQRNHDGNIIRNTKLFQELIPTWKRTPNYSRKRYPQENEPHCTEFWQPNNQTS